MITGLDLSSPPRRAILTGLAGLATGALAPGPLAAVRRADDARWIEPYDFSLSDPFAATVVGTPLAEQSERPELRVGVNAFRDRVGVLAGRGPRHLLVRPARPRLRRRIPARPRPARRARRRHGRGVELAHDADPRPQSSGRRLPRARALLAELRQFLDHRLDERRAGPAARGRSRSASGPRGDPAGGRAADRDHRVASRGLQPGCGARRPSPPPGRCARPVPLRARAALEPAQEPVQLAADRRCALRAAPRRSAAGPGLRRRGVSGLRRAAEEGGGVRSIPRATSSSMSIVRCGRVGRRSKPSWASFFG